MLDDHRPADRPPGVAEQEGEQRELLGRQVDLPAGSRDPTGRGIDDEVGDPELDGLLLTPAQQRTDPRRQLGEREGLHHVVVGAEVETADAVLEGAFGGEHEHRKPGLVSADAAKQLETGQPRKHQVEDHEVVVHGLDEVQGGLPVVCDINGVALLFQAFLDEARHLRLVLDDEQAHGFSRIRSRPGHVRRRSARIVRRDMPVVATASEPIAHSGSVSSRKTTTENADAAGLPTPNAVSPMTVKNWYVPTFAGALGSAVPRCTIMKTTPPAHGERGNP